MYSNTRSPTLASYSRKGLAAFMTFTTGIWRGKQECQTKVSHTVCEDGIPEEVALKMRRWNPVGFGGSVICFWLSLVICILLCLSHWHLNALVFSDRKSLKTKNWRDLSNQASPLCFLIQNQYYNRYKSERCEMKCDKMTIDMVCSVLSNH